MLRVKTRLDFSDVHGLGVFAVEPIEKGQVVIRHHEDFDLVFTDDDIAKLPNPMREAIEYYGFRYEKEKLFVYNIDNERFLNHSDTPNVRSGRRIMLAARDIAVGEELTVDYRTFCDDCAAEGVEAIFRMGRAFMEGDTRREGN